MNTQRPRAMRLQFSLRAVLVILTLAAIGGWWWQKRFQVESMVSQRRVTKNGLEVADFKKTQSMRRQGLDKIVRDGPTTVVDDEGNIISEEEWRQGRRHGVYRRWDNNGELQFDCEFSRGKLVRVGEHKVTDFLSFSETGDSQTSSPGAGASILRALYSDADFNYLNQPFNEIVDDIKFRYQIPILIDTQALDELGVAVDTPITSSMRGAPLFVALIELLGPLELACAYRHEVIWMTTPDSSLFDDEKVARVVSDGQSRHVDQALAGEADFDYLDQPLNEVLDDIGFRYRIKVDRELENPGEGISSNVKGISLRSALGILSHQHDLRCVAQDGKLVVTDAEPNAPD